jgi:tetratricopeptide (TPR) repeat protein
MPGFFTAQECEDRLLDARALWVEGDLESAVELYLEVYNSYQALHRRDEALSTLAEIAEAYERFDEIEKARAYMERAFREDPANPRLLLRVGEWHLRQRDLERAQRVFRALLLQPIVDGGPTRAVIYLRLAQLESAQQDFAKAESMVQRGLEAEPSHRELLEELARIQRRDPPELPTKLTRPAPPNNFADGDTMKQHKKCPKCKHNRILYIEHVADQIGEIGDGLSTDENPEVNVSAAKSFRVARVPNPKKGFWQAAAVTAGLVEAYVCRQCGFTEFYTKDPSQIPIDGEYVKEIVGPEDHDPYR